MELLCREYKIIDPTQQNSLEVNQTFVWEITRSDLLALLSEVSVILSHMTMDSIIFKKLTDEFDCVLIIRNSLNRYLIENDFFDLSEIIV